MSVTLVSFLCSWLGSYRHMWTRDKGNANKHRKWQKKCHFYLMSTQKFAWWKLDKMNIRRLICQPKICSQALSIRWKNPIEFFHRVSYLKICFFNLSVHLQSNTWTFQIGLCIVAFLWGTRSYQLSTISFFLLSTSFCLYYIVAAKVNTTRKLSASRCRLPSKTYTVVVYTGFLCTIHCVFVMSLNLRERSFFSFVWVVQVYVTP